MELKKVYTLHETDKAANLFDGWEETLIWSCLQGVMGKIRVTDTDCPSAACARQGCFFFYAGNPERELVLDPFSGFAIMTPQNDEWAKLIMECFPSARRATRYAIKKNTRFDTDKLERMAGTLPKGYEMKAIDSELYDMCLNDPMTEDFVSVFDNKEQFLRLGRGIVITKNGKIVSGASSYSRYREGIEIEVDTVPEERRKHLATAAASSLILNCLKEGLYPSWDAHNMASVRLAEKLGYEFSHEYPVYEVLHDVQGKRG